MASWGIRTEMTARKMLEGFKFLNRVLVEFEEGEIEGVVRELFSWQSDAIKKSLNFLSRQALFPAPLLVWVPLGPCIHTGRICCRVMKTEGSKGNY